MKAHVWVMPKRTVLDPQGQTIHHALSGLGFAAIKDVRQGKFFVLNLDGWDRDQPISNSSASPKKFSPTRLLRNTASRSSTNAPL